MPKVVYSPAALEDLQLIRDYIEDKWGENVAIRILRKMTSDIRRLEQYPSSGVDLSKLTKVPTQYRYLFSEKNYIFYRIELDEIRIVRVLSELQDYMKQLFGISPELEEA